MKIAARLRQATKKLAATMVATATAASLAVIGGGVAHADNRDWLRPDATGACDWDAAMYWVQRCDVYSPAMGRNIPVLIQPAQRGGDAGFYLLDGMRADDNQTGWTKYVNAAPAYVDSNLTLIMPVGGAGSFYTDWNGQPMMSSQLSGGSRTYMWETFLTAELPAYLQQNFGVSPTNNSIAGLSMGGTAALNLAARHPGQFRQAMSWSGYLTTTAPGMQTLLRIALLDSGGFNINAMYGAIISPRRFENDPYYNMAGLAGKDVYISAATGAWGPGDWNRPINERIMGSGLEALSRMTTVAWESKARRSGLNVTADYAPTGIHNWGIWNDQLWKTRNRVLDVMGAW
ncbi:alpha/beta hydrolase [Corynebacterium epidermidicanis]|uniref:Putative esterase n=1 Tax=Corynebacterium epidermidicanis TaxID=1050174 RepID=A0A0G3GZD0_9CORY|nr:alpha/beta hydrolase family protein [Corynebacterium epidermidicanis]AKK04157.1 putative esterase [Corynebacterium epidermidicanis]